MITTGNSADAQEVAQTQQKPNIIYIMCDDMGYGDLGCYGQQFISTPRIDNMAAEGMRFTQAYAGSPVFRTLACLLYDRTTFGPYSCERQ